MVLRGRPDGAQDVNETPRSERIEEFAMKRTFILAMAFFLLETNGWLRYSFFLNDLTFEISRFIDVSIYRFDFSAAKILKLLLVLRFWQGKRTIGRFRMLPKCDLRVQD